MRFGILGSLEVTDDQGRSLSLAAPKQQAVLAVLLLHANEVVSSDRLIEDLWADGAPASAAKSLQVHVSRLRRALGDGGGDGQGRLVTVTGGYRLRVAPEELDAERFGQMVEEGQALAQAGRWEPAAERFGEALGLWRGRPLSDFEYESFAQAEIARLAELHVSAVEQRVAAEIAVGRETQVIAELERLVRQYPYRERLRCQLMLALYRTGRQADALRAYRDARAVLIEELGVEPSVELRGLQEAILRQDPSLVPPPAVEAWPVPSALRSVPRAPYVGRADERALIERSRAQARAGARGVVLLSGEPGIGKTRLASYAALGANAEGFAVCWGACSEELAAPYEPWIEVCSQLVEHAPSDVLDGYVAAHGGEIGGLARNLARRVPDAPAPQSTDPETERFLLFKAVGELLLAVARSQPLCVVLDDFHWADGQSVALLKHVARAVEQDALMVIVTYRDSDLTRDHPLTGVLADLRRSEGVERIRLSGLGPDEVAELVAGAAGHELDADGLALAGGLATETGGNPFFVGEILRNLIESGAITFDETARRWSVDRGALSSLPESVREVVEQRIYRLGEQARETLRIAAVIGRSFDVELLAQLVEISEARLLDVLEAAVQASLLRESTEVVGRFDFEHALINHTLYQGLGGTRRARLHHRVAEAIEQLHGPESDEHLGELALHWRLATVSVDRLRAAGYSLRAGRRALDSLAPSDAAKLFGDALDMLGSVVSAARCEALIGLGEAQRQTGVPAYRETLLEAAGIASELGDADLAARATLANNRGFVSSYGGVDLGRVAAIERALELDDPPQPARHARLLALLAKELAFEPDRSRRRALADEAIALARQASDPWTLAEVLESCCYATWAPDTLATRSEHVRELSALVAQVGDLRVEFVARLRETNTAIELGDFRWADAALERAQAIAEQTRQPTQRWNTGFLAAGMMCMRGELDAGEQLAEQALALGQEAGQPDTAMIYGGTIVLNRMIQGRGAEVIALIERMVAEYPGVPAWEAALGYTCCLIDRRREGAEILARAAAQHFERLRDDQNRTTGLALYADTAAQTRSIEAAAMLYELIKPYAGQFIWNAGVSFGHARTYLAMLAATLGRHEPADADFAFACEFHHRHGLHPWQARSELGWAEALAERGELDRAREHASRALELSRDHGYSAFEPRAAAIMASHAAVQP